jgi:transposase-like protein
MIPGDEILALRRGGKSVGEVCTKLGLKASQVYAATWRETHRNLPNGGRRTKPGFARAQQAVELLKTKSISEVAAELGVLASTVRGYRSMLHPAQTTPTKYDAGGARCPRCNLLLPHQCLPDSAVSMLGRRGDPLAEAIRLRGF